MTQKGQIIKHEWEHVYKMYNSSMKKCKHCHTEKFIGHGTNKVEFYINGVPHEKEPPCITRKTTEDVPRRPPKPSKQKAPELSRA